LPVAGKGCPISQSQLAGGPDFRVEMIWGAPQLNLRFYDIYM
jgi:hypothetical protein